MDPVGSCPDLMREGGPGEDKIVHIPGRAWGRPDTWVAGSFQGALHSLCKWMWDGVGIGEVKLHGQDLGAPAEHRSLATIPALTPRPSHLPHERTNLE
ncbi:hypothetical protein Tco_0044401 [Tanacetum coccineum]